MTDRPKEECDQVIEVQERELQRVRTLLINISEMIGISLDSSEEQEQRDSQKVAQQSTKQAVRIVGKWLGSSSAGAPQVSTLTDDYKITSGEDQQPLQILVAEDDPTSQRLLSRLLSKQGHLVTIAGNGRIAIDLLSRKPFDMILMDIQMPQMDGVDAIRFIREREVEHGTRIPIIAITGMELLAKTHPDLLSNIDGYLRKPINSKQLTQAIRDAAVTAQ